jgi:hypothetical protein
VVKKINDKLIGNLVVRSGDDLTEGEELEVEGWIFLYTNQKCCLFNHFHRYEGWH